MQTAMSNPFRSRWWAPLYSLGLGAIVFAAFAVGGNVAAGAEAFALFVIVAAFFWFCSPRSDTLGGLAGAGRDERWAAIDLRASAFGGFVVIVAAVGGIAYIAAFAFLRRRS